MIRQRYHIKVDGEDWGITVFFPLTCYHKAEIMGVLASIECNAEDMRNAWRNLSSGMVNNGLTFSNYELRESVVVFAMSESKEEYFNLVVHELHHLSVHIAEANGIALDSEEVCYINGDIAMMMYPLVGHLFC